MEKLLENDWFVYFIVTLILLILQRLIINSQDELIEKQNKIIDRFIKRIENRKK